LKDGGARKMLLGKMKSEKFWVRRNWFFENWRCDLKGAGLNGVRLYIINLDRRQQIHDIDRLAKFAKVLLNFESKRL
jgi:hypothetical protein